MTGRNVAALVVAGVLALAAAGCARGVDAAYEEAVAAESRGDWPAAFSGYLDTERRTPGFGDVTARLDSAASRLIELVPDGLDVDVEMALLRWLAEQGDTGALVQVLEQSGVVIPAGWGLMGDDEGRPAERPARRVFLDRFRLDRYEVTNAQYARYAAEAGGPVPVYWQHGRYPPGTEDHPVVGVPWSAADGYCRWAGRRLPTEAEWERACRGEGGTAYPWGDRWDATRANLTVFPLEDPDLAWPLLRSPSDEPGVPRPAPVGSFPQGRTPLGVLDLVGNVTEWVEDRFDAEAYRRLPDRDPVATGPPWSHSVRGSAWIFVHPFPDLVPDVSRCAFRGASHSHDDPRVGFRCASDA